MRLALAQYSMSADRQENLARVLGLIERASHRHADLVLFPELCVSPFFPQYAKQRAEHFAVTLEDPVVQEVRAVCKRVKIAASPNFYLREGDRLFDASLMIGADGSVQGVSKMVHIAQVPRFFEQDYYTPSDTGFKVYDTPRGRIGIVVCFDRHYPESVRTCVLRGAHLVLIPTANTVDEPREIFDCEVRAAAFQNGVFIAMCNRVGAEGEVVFCGESVVVDPNGCIVQKASASPKLLITDIDLEEVARARKTRPYLSLRRPEAYA